MTRVTRFFKEYHIERLVWCLFVAAFCWTDVADFHHMTYNKQLCLWVVLGGYYLFKQGFFHKENKKMIILCFAAASVVSIFLIGTNFFSGYYFYNYTISAWLFIAIPQYVALLNRIRKEKKLPGLSVTAIVMFLMFAWTWLSANENKISYLYMFLILFPYACMDFKEQERKDIWLGMIDGICLGFFFCQGYTFLFKQYTMGTGYRFKGYRSVIAYGGMSYMLFYIGFFMKYILYTEEKAKKWKRIGTFFLAAFCVSLLYLTGSRSAAIGVGLSTAVLVLWLYRKAHWKALAVRWTVKCASIAILSVLLFPLAYAGTSYLPRILQHPDLQDSIGNRLYSFAHVALKQTYLYDGEWSAWSVKANEPRNSHKYIGFYECLDETICRVIPGLDDLLMPLIKDKVFEQKAMHYLYAYEEGYVSLEGVQDYLRYFVTQYQQDKIPGYMLDFIQKVTEQRESAKQEKTGQEMVPVKAVASNVVMAYDKAAVSRAVAVSSKATVLRVAIADSKAASRGVSVKNNKVTTGSNVAERRVVEAGETVVLQRGDSAEYGWFEQDEAYSEMQLRIAIHQYTIGKLNCMGHKEGTYHFYQKTGREYDLIHGHNIFLVVGYDYGIPAMVLMILLFVLLCCVGWRHAKLQNRGCYLLVPVLVLAFTGYGWFEYGFGCGNMLTTLVFLCAVLLRSEKVFAVSEKRH